MDETREAQMASPYVSTSTDISKRSTYQIWQIFPALILVVLVTSQCRSLTEYENTLEPGKEIDTRISLCDRTSPPFTGIHSKVLYDQAKDCILKLINPNSPLQIQFEDLNFICVNGICELKYERKWYDLSFRRYVLTHISIVAVLEKYPQITIVHKSIGLIEQQ
jgi:hypothetical protein